MSSTGEAFQAQAEAGNFLTAKDLTGSPLSEWDGKLESAKPANADEFLRNVRNEMNQRFDEALSTRHLHNIEHQIKRARGGVDDRAIRTDFVDNPIVEQTIKDIIAKGKENQDYGKEDIRRDLETVRQDVMDKVQDVEGLLKPAEPEAPAGPAAETPSAVRQQPPGGGGWTAPTQ